ncbi:AAA family ATPase [Lactococcus cremoris]|uniref:AAA family ATPase n=1 Tax=Lactococcus lactis subsp. cremoris TaxID=1359 RepID=UPI0003ABBA5E|nr:AAA family ATPase [Lactococcus cremoris]AGV73440.1 hypothetical protein kw2_1482 [Lactococcus cremoris subsp. cremoris KW2]
MSELTINLAQHQFDDGSKIFSDADICLKNKNFIFAKNGSGKSTLSKIIKAQKQADFDVQIFNGFSSLIGENENLDAFALAVNAGENEEKIKEKSQQVEEKTKEWNSINEQITKPEADGENLFTKLEKAQKVFKNKDETIKFFRTRAAKQISEKHNPVIVENARSYQAPKFKGEISKAKLLQNTEIEQFKQTLKTEEKTANKIIYHSPDFDKYLKSVNEILASKVEEEIAIERISDNQAKRHFAEQGLAIYKDTHNEICAFCGNVIEDTKLEELKRYFDADKVKALKDRIINGKSIISQEIEKLNQVNIVVSDFYPSLKGKASEQKANIDTLKREQLNNFWDILSKALDDKEKNLFEVSDDLLISLPENLNFDDYNDLVDENDTFTQNFTDEQIKARNELRYHEIKVLLDNENYAVEISKLANLKSSQDAAQKAVDDQTAKAKALELEISTLQAEIEQLKPKAEQQAIDHINEKLRQSVPWELHFAGSEDEGYYNVLQDAKERSVKLLSTGEKNIIAFLYFVEKLEEVKEEQNGKPKIIIFDDPMNSNDDTMQYLIITELQKLYQSTKDGYKTKFNLQRDHLIILTHNVHFYLNVQPQGYYKENKIDKNEDGSLKLNGAGKPKLIETSKYDKNNFYRLQDGKFKLIKTETDDFKTNYDAIWYELQSLVDNDLRNSMLNSMRRIIETYIGFNSLNRDEFYKGKEQYLKLFNVNSHLAIENISAESFTESAEELKQLFKQLFIDNNAEDHFKTHWKEVQNEQ